MKKYISVDEVAHLPLPGQAIPGSLEFSPDGRWVSFLKSDNNDLVRQLYKLDLQTGETALLVPHSNEMIEEKEIPLEIKLIRERIRQYELGITSYSWSPKGDMLLIPRVAGLNIHNAINGEVIMVIPGGGNVLINSQFSPNGRFISFVKQGEIFITSLVNGETNQLTQGSSGVTNGLAEYVAQEEMGRQQGYWWSSDSQKIAYIELSQDHVPIYSIIHQGIETTTKSPREEHHYPFAGESNAYVRLGVISMGSQKPVWMDLGNDRDIYLARVRWHPDGSLVALILTRDQKTARLMKFDPVSGNGIRLLEESNPVWINLHNILKFLADGSFIWASEKSGYRHLYLYQPDGINYRQLTSGDWIVDSIEGLDETNRIVYFLGTKDDYQESHLYSTSLDSDSIQRITQESGTHSVVVDIQNKRYLDIHESLKNPPNIKIKSLSNEKAIQSFFTAHETRLSSIDLLPPEVVTIQTRMGTNLSGAIFRPGTEYGPGPYPSLIYVYGGPHSQLVTNSWRLTSNMRAQYLRSLGYLVFVLDNRGTSRRGIAFEEIIDQRLGEIELQDQINGVNWLVEQGLADSSRIGVYGWSYGGFMALMCLFLAPEVFKLAIAGAPVTNWDGYDTHYTERYMNTPKNNPIGYKQSSVINHVGKMRGRLLLVHGLIDENVHFRHTARLINALIENNKQFELIVFPDGRHSLRKFQDRIYLEGRIRDFIKTNL